MKKGLFKLVSSISLGVLTIVGVSLITSCDKEQPTKYEVVFRSNGGTTYYNVAGYSGDTITLPTPTKEGYTFQGWYTDSKFETEVLGETYTIDIGRTLYAKWSPYEGTIIFESNGGTEYEDLVFSAQKVEIPSPEKEGFIFEGWYLNQTFEGEKVEGTILPTGDMKLYAKWSAITGTITFESNGGTQYEKIETSGQMVKIPSPTKNQSIFAGWYDNKDFKGKAIEGEYLPVGDVTLYARWATKYQLVTLEENGGNEVSDIKLFDDDKFELPTPERYGYKFIGWYDNSTFNGEPISDYFYRPLEDITLYAKWQKCTYLYMFYGEHMDFERFEFLPNDVITVDELYELFEPESLNVKDYLGDDRVAPFKYWEHQGYDASTNYEVVEDIVVGNENIIISAKYDYSNVPAKEYLELNRETNVWTTTGKVAHVFMDAPATLPYVYTADFTFKKVTSGGAFGPAIRMNTQNIDYHYEAGCDYISAVIGGEGGALSLYGIYQGDYSKITGVSFGSLPLNWQNKFNKAKEGENIDVRMSIIDRGTSIEVYIDGELALNYTDSNKLAQFTYSKVGFRSSAAPVYVSNPSVSNGYTISFETNDSNFTSPSVKWFCGDIDLPYFEKENSALAGWYYDEACTQAVDYENLMVNKDTTLYAKWSSEYHVISFETNGGSSCNNINYVAGKIILPTPTKMNHVFTGWYYDEACSQLVDENNLNISKDTKLYAGWRLPYHKFTVSSAGRYTYTANSVAVVGVVENPIPLEGTYNEYTQTVTVKKGTGSAGIAFRMNVCGDYSYEAGNNYLSVQIASGGLRISKTTNGNWTRIVSDVGLSSLPQDYQDKYNAAGSEDEISIQITIKDHGSYFDIYLDGEFARKVESNQQTDLLTYTGNGYGIRSSCASYYTNMSASVITIN